MKISIKWQSLIAIEHCRNGTNAFVAYLSKDYCRVTADVFGIGKNGKPIGVDQLRLYVLLID